MSAYETGYDPVYGSMSREELALLANQGGARRRAIERELLEREAANVAANLAAADSEFEMDPVVPYRTAPGRVSMATGEADPGMELQDPRAIAEYQTRVPASEATDEQMDAAGRTSLYTGGPFLPSPEDLDMYQRGQVYTINPATGARGYSPAVPQGPVGFGEPGRLGHRIDLEQPVINSATNQPIQGTHKYEKNYAESPFGQQEVYRPSTAFRQQLDAREATLREERLASAAGPYAAEGMDLDQLRAAGRQRRELQRDVRQSEVTRRAMERQNPTALMDPEWRQHVSAVRLLGPKAAGPSPSALKAAELAQPPAPQDPMVIFNAQEERAEEAVLVEARKRAAAGHFGMSLQGYNDYDQAEYNLRHLGLSPEQKDRVLADLFPGGKPLYPWQEREAAERAAGDR
jgi:hypothetical protein